MAHALTSVRVRLRTVLLFAIGALVLFVLSTTSPLSYVVESDEHFVERQRLLRRTRELRRTRSERQRRYRESRSVDPLLEQRTPEQLANASSNEEAKPVVVSPVRKRKSTPEDANAELEIVWDDDSYVSKICRIRHACVERGMVVAVPEWMRSQVDRLANCGVYEPHFISAKEWNATNANANLDLFGALPVRYHIPHFVTDLLPALYASEVMRPTFSDRKTRRSECMRADSRPCERSKEELKMALLTEDRVATMRSEAWVPQLVRMLPQKPVLAFPRNIYKNGARACFRSVITYAPHSYVRRGRHWYGSQHAMFTQNKISRASVNRAPERGKCRVRITVLNRFGWLRRSGYLVGRDIMNVDEILAKLEQASRRTKTRDGVKLELDVAVEYFENTKFRDQVDIMQRADVILGVHGAGLGNLLFARLDAPFIEVFPFGYYAGPFERLSEALHLQYHNIVSEPDTANFYECINARAQQMARPEVVTSAKQMWKKALKEWKRGERRVLNAHDFRDRDTTPMKLCARSQRMKLNVRETVKLLMESARSICMQES